MSEVLFRISLASALAVFGGVSVFKFTHGPKVESPDIQDLPTDRP